MAFKSPWICQKKQEDKCWNGIPGEGGAVWEMGAASLHNDFFKKPKNVTSESPIAPMRAMVRWWEALRAPEVATWHHTYRVEGGEEGATDGRNGGAESTVWETLLEMERLPRQ